MEISSALNIRNWCQCSGEGLWLNFVAQGKKYNGCGGNQALRYYAILQSEKMCLFYKFNTCLQKTTTCIRLQAEQPSRLLCYMFKNGPVVQMKKNVCQTSFRCPENNFRLSSECVLIAIYIHEKTFRRNILIS